MNDNAVILRRKPWETIVLVLHGTHLFIGMGSGSRRESVNEFFDTSEQARKRRDDIVIKVSFQGFHSN